MVPLWGLQLNNISKSYWHVDKEISVLKDINFEVGEGEIVSITGPSGSGKTTFLKALIGQVPLKSGTIKIKKKMN